MQTIAVPVVTVETESEHVPLEPEEGHSASDAAPATTEAEADFTAGYVDQPRQSTEDTPPATEASQTPAPSETTPAPEFVNVTKDEYKRLADTATKVDSISAALDKLTGTTFGRFGELQRTLKQMKEATPSGQSVQLSAEDFAELKAEYPDVADMTLKGMNRALGKIKGTGPTLDEHRVGELVDQRAEKIRQDAAFEIMDTVEPDWRETVNSDPFRAWLSTKPHDVQTKVLESWKPREVRGYIGEYRAFNDAAIKAAAAPTPKDTKPSPSDARRVRMAEAIQPRGVAADTGASVSEEDDFVGGFNRERAK